MVVAAHPKAPQFFCILRRTHPRALSLHSPTHILLLSAPTPLSSPPQGFPVAEKQLTLPLDGFGGAGAPAAAPSAVGLTIQDGPATVAIAGGPADLLVEVSKATGALTCWSVGGAQLLAEPMLPCFYRAPTDNDRGGSGGNSFVSR